MSIGLAISIGTSITDIRSTGSGGGGGIPDNAMLWPDGGVMKWFDTSNMLWPT